MNRRVFIAILGVGLAGVFGFAAQLVKTVDGVAIASVKSDSAVVIASVKTIAGVDNTSGGGTTPPTFDAAGSNTTPTANVFIATVSAGSLTNGYCRVTIYCADGSTAPTSVVDSDAVSYTQVPGAVSTDFTVYTSVWEAVKGTRGAGSLSVTVTFTTATVGFVGIETYNGVNQSTPSRTGAATSGTSTSPSQSVTTVTNDLVTDFVVNVNGGLTVGGGQTQRLNVGGTYGTSTKTATTTSTTMSWTQTTGPWVIVLAPLVPAS